MEEMEYQSSMGSQEDIQGNGDIALFSLNLSSRSR
jgi:hypothetical protein